MKKAGYLVLLAVIAAVAACWLISRRGDAGAGESAGEGRRPRSIAVKSSGNARAEGRNTAAAPVARREADEEADSEKEAAAVEEPLSEEERREREEQARVDAFDALTDKWMEPAKDGVSMKDVDEFSAQFRNVPKDRKEECLHRALNLVPDENVMLLAGILMDKSQDKELIELVYNDVLNRDEGVKKPILQQIFKDKSHPCWADTAWILDVTGELPAGK